MSSLKAIRQFQQVQAYIQVQRVMYLLMIVAYVRTLKARLNFPYGVRGVESIPIDMDNDGNIGSYEDEDGDPMTSAQESFDLALVSTPDGIVVVDVSKPESPLKMDMIPVSAGKILVDREKRVAYVLNGGGLSVISLKDLRPLSDSADYGVKRDEDGDKTDDRVLHTLKEAAGTDMVLSDDGSLMYIADYTGGVVKVVDLGLVVIKLRLCPVDDECRKEEISETTNSAVDLTLGEYTDKAVDLAVKVQGHMIEVKRRFYDNSWHFDQLRSLDIVYDESIENVEYIVADGVQFNKANDDGTFFTYRPDLSYAANRTIEVNAGGFLWKDRYGNWRQYDALGRFLSYGNSNNVKVSYIYGGDGRLSGVSDHFGNQVLWYEYNVDGKISAVRDSSSRRVTYSYNGDKLSRVVDVLGNESSYDYGGDGRIISKSDAAGGITNITYNGVGYVTSVTAADGTGKSFAYDMKSGDYHTRVTSTSGRVKEVWIDRLGNRIREYLNGRTDYKITINGRTKIIEDASENQTTKAYDEQGNLLSVTHPDGSTVQYTYEPQFNKLLSKTDELGHITEYAYDTYGNMTQAVEAVGTADERVTEYTYDSFGNPVTMKFLGDSKTAEAVTNMSYDNSGNMETITDPEGGITRFTYNVMGNILTRVDARTKTWRYEYNGLGWLTKSTDPLGNSRGLVYDAVGKQIQETDEEGKVKTSEYDIHDNLIKSTDTAGKATLYEYDTDRNLTKLTDPEGKTVIFQYDLDGRLVKTIDGNSNEISIEYSASGAGCSVCLGDSDVDQPSKVIYPTFTRTYEYDARNRKTVERDVLNESETFTTLFEYDSAGNLITQTDKESKSTLYEYDSLSRLIRETGPAGKVTEYTYDDRGGIVALEDGENNITRFEYDRNNKEVKEIRPMGEETAYEYDSVGNLIKKTDAESRKIEFSYDSAGRLINGTFTASDGTVTKTIAYDYKKTGHLVSYNDGVTSAQYVYDNEYRKISETVNYGAFNLTYSYTYYANGRKKSFTGPDGIAYQYTYDSNNQLANIQIPGTGNIFYDSYTWNRPNSVTLPGGSTMAYAYDPLMRTESITDKDPAQAINMDYNYIHDKMDNILNKNTEHGSYVYGYDDVYRLTSADNPSSSDESYTYDDVGNRLTSASYNDWQYNGNNELLSYNGATFGYDENGNMTQKTKGTGEMNFVYDVDNRLIRVEDESSSVIAEYYYDPFGRRLWKEVGGTRTYYLYSDEGLVGEYDATGVEIKTYGYKPDSTWMTDPLFMKQGTEYYFYHNDHLGTPMIMTDINGSIVWSAIYDSFGKAEVQPSSTIENDLRFPGQYYDSETGLHYNWYRYYEPEIGRYLRTDPIGFLGGDLNLYAYVGNNPVNFVDPWGLIVYVASRDVATWYTLGIGTHQFFIMVPDNPADFSGKSPVMRDLGGGKRGFVIGAQEVNGRLQAGFFNVNDLQATKELFDQQNNISWYKPDFDTDVRQCNSVITDTALINELISATNNYIKNEIAKPISYGWPGTGKPNSNSWAQSILRYSGGSGPQNMRGWDIYRNLRIPSSYFAPSP